MKLILKNDKEQLSIEISNNYIEIEEPTKIDKYLNFERKILERINEICKPVDWSTIKTQKWLIYYDHFHKSLFCEQFNSAHFGPFVCDTKAHAEQICEEFEKELIWMFREFHK